MKEKFIKKNSMKWNAFPEVNSAEILQNYLFWREYTHSRYFHYTKVDAINSILAKHELWLSCVSGFNDSLDKEQFSDQNCYYSICFSTGLNENLPLWYLYSGIDGMGARLELTKSAIAELINTSDYYLCWDDKQKEMGKCMLKLKDGETMRRYFGDVIYRAPYTDADFVDLKYNTMTNHIMPAVEMKTFENKFRGFQKGLIWYYEKETRLVVRLIGEAQQKVSDCSAKVICVFDEKLLNRLKVTFAPNVKNIDTVIEEYPAIKQLRDKSSNISLSQYSGTVDFRLKDSLCQQCDKNKPEQNESTESK